MSMEVPLRVHWEYKGADKVYLIYLDDEVVHAARTGYDRDMFVAELKARVKLLKRREEINATANCI
jgi:hypothetical protein